MKEIVNFFNDADWKDAPGYPEGTKMKVLYDKGGVKTFLLKAGKDIRIDVHSHSHAEQHFSLKGEHSYGGQLFQEETFRCFKPDEIHGPFEIKEGSILMVLWHPYGVEE
jgi:hypothetical protein